MMDTTNATNSSNASNELMGNQEFRPTGVVQGTPRQLTRISPSNLTTNVIQNTDNLSNTSRTTSNNGLSNESARAETLVTVTVSPTVRSFINVIPQTMNTLSDENTVNRFYNPSYLSNIRSNFSNIGNTIRNDNFLYNIDQSNNFHESVFNINRSLYNSYFNLLSSSNQTQNLEMNNTSLLNRGFNDYNQSILPSSNTRIDSVRELPSPRNENVLSTNGQNVNRNDMEVIDEILDRMHRNLISYNQQITNNFETTHSEANQNAINTGRKKRSYRRRVARKAPSRGGSVLEINRSVRTSLKIQKANKRNNSRIMESPYDGDLSDGHYDGNLTKKSKKSPRKESTTNSKNNKKKNKNEKGTQTDDLDIKSCKNTAKVFDMDNVFKKNDKEKLHRISLHQFISLICNKTHDDVFSYINGESDDSNAWYHQMIDIPYAYIVGRENKIMSLDGSSQSSTNNNTSDTEKEEDNNKENS
uniref:HSF_DOMAIN domain-containing protein n=1 Tax=Strongyloides papillosus TaxID=174720 RepID=A0A0N5BS57_STREA